MPTKTKSLKEWPPRKVICVGAVVLQNDRVLLIWQAPGTSLAGQWSIPWGIVDAGEMPDAAALRETLEESGVTAEIEGLLGYQNYRWESMVAFVYLCRHVSGEPTGDGAETDMAAYLSLEELDTLDDPIENWCDWLIRRVLVGQYHLIPPLSENPVRPLTAFF